VKTTLKHYQFSDSVMFMSALTHDTTQDVRTPRVTSPSQRLTTGLVFAVVSAVTFGMSGALARGLLDTGWSPGAVVLVRVGLAAALVLPFGLAALRGRWSLLRRNWALVTAYGTLAVAGAQFCYFSAIDHMQVGPALLIEYTAPAVVVAYLWLRYGERPGALTLVGAALAAVGLVLVLNLLTGAALSTTGVLWALGATAGCATYFIINSHEDTGLPPIVLAAAGLVIGALGLGLLGLVHVLPMTASTHATSYAGRSVTWWVPLVALGVVTAAIAYVTGIAAGRRLGSRLASFVALLEVVAGVVWAWVLLSQLPGAAQFVGGLLILAGVVAVKAGERSVAAREPLLV
jgi:drug/metabolite transporter (DMT)-like permease